MNKANEPDGLIENAESLESILSKRKLTDDDKALIKDTFAYLLERTKLANYDGLTGLLRKEVFGDLVSRIMASSHENTNISLIYLDIDNFKKINDTYGHTVGDYVLKEFSKQIKKTLRPYDMVGRIGSEKVRKPGQEKVGRIGGEEFAAVLAIPLKETIKVAERIRKNVEQYCRFYVRGENDVINVVENTKADYDPTKIINLTVSVGVAALDPLSMQNKEQFCIKADKALYDAKHSGRNKVVAYHPAQSTSSK